MTKEDKDIILITDYETLTNEELIDSLYDEINFAVKNRVSHKFIEEDKILDSWNERLLILKGRLENDK